MDNIYIRTSNLLGRLNESKLENSEEKSKTRKDSTKKQELYLDMSIMSDAYNSKKALFDRLKHL